MTKETLVLPHYSYTNILALNFYTVRDIVVRTRSQNCPIKGRSRQITYPGIG